MSNVPEGPGRPTGDDASQRKIEALADRLGSFEEQMQSLRKELQELRAGASRQPDAKMEPSQDPAAQAEAQPSPADKREVPTSQSEPSLPPAGRTPPPASRVPPTVRPAAASVSAPGPAVEPREPHVQPWSISNLEDRIGGAWLSWLGGAFLLIGAAWFFKYAAEQGWVNPWIRVGTGWAAAVVLLGLGEWATRRRMAWLGAALTGAAVGLGYLSSYAASPLLYGLLGLTASYAVLSGFTAVGIVQAVRLNQLPTAVLALLGGFLTLVLVRSSNPSAASLLAYLIALSAGAIVAGQIRRWPALRYLAWSGDAVLVALYLTGPHAAGTELPVLLTLLPLLFAMFHLDVFLWRVRKPDEDSTAASILLGLNATGLALAVHQAVLAEQVAVAVGITLFALAAVQAATARGLWTLRPSEQNRRAAVAVYGQAALAAAIALPVAFDRQLVVLGWAAQAVTMAWLVRHVRSVGLRVAVAALPAAAIIYIGVMFQREFMLAGPTVWDLHLATRTWLAGCVALASAACSLLMGRWYATGGWQVDRLVGEACAVLAAAATVIAGAALLSASPPADLWVWVIIAVAGCLGLLSHRARHLRMPAVMSIAVLAGLAMIAMDGNGTLRETVFRAQPWRLGAVDFGPLLPAGLALVVLGLWNGWLVRHSRTIDDEARVLGDVIVVAAMLGMLLVLHNQVADDSAALAVLAATIGSAIVAAMGLRWSAPAFALCGAGGWALAAAYWIVAATVQPRFGAAGEPTAGWTAVAPFINTTFLAALVLMATAWPITVALRRSAAVQKAGWQVAAAVPAGLAAYLLLHALSFEVDRLFQVYGTRLAADPVHAERMALSVLWALLALAYVVTGLAASIRPLRLFGLGLFALTAGKVLLIDMARVEVLYRVLSAMGLGILALLGSYAYQRVRRTAGSGSLEEPVPAERG